MKAETTYFAVDFKTRSKCENLYTKYKLGKYIGKGAYAKVFDVCKAEKDCKYVLKVSTYDQSIYNLTGLESHSMQSYYNRWVREIDMHSAMEKCQVNFYYKFTPILYDAWYCLEGNQALFYMVIEKYDGNLFDFIKKFKRNGEDVQKLLRSYVKTILRDLKISLHHVHNTCNICINDIKMENILYKEKDAEYIFVFADFGLTSKCSINPDEECKKEDRRKLDVTIETFLNQLGVSSD